MLIQPLAMALRTSKGANWASKACPSLHMNEIALFVQRNVEHMHAEAGDRGAYERLREGTKICVDLL